MCWWEKIRVGAHLSKGRSETFFSARRFSGYFIDLYLGTYDRWVYSLAWTGGCGRGGYLMGACRFGRLPKGRGWLKGRFTGILSVKMIYVNKFIVRLSRKWSRPRKRSQTVKTQFAPSFANGSYCTNISIVSPTPSPTLCFYHIIFPKVCITWQLARAYCLPKLSMNCPWCRIRQCAQPTLKIKFFL